MVVVVVAVAVAVGEEDNKEEEVVEESRPLSLLSFFLSFFLYEKGRKFYAFYWPAQDKKGNSVTFFLYNTKNSALVF